jgi:hypothetical protein
VAASGELHYYNILSFILGLIKVTNFTVGKIVSLATMALGRKRDLSREEVAYVNELKRRGIDLQLEED